MIRAQVDAKSVEEAAANVRHALTSPAILFDASARVLEQYVRNTFRSETDPWGNAWPPHSPVTVAIRQDRGEYSAQKLIDSGAMFGSIRAFADGTGAGVEMGEGLPGDYASVHQFGNPSNKAWGFGSAPIPARPSFPMRSPEQAAFPDDWLLAVFAPVETALEGRWQTR